MNHYCEGCNSSIGEVGKLVRIGRIRLCKDCRLYYKKYLATVGPHRILTYLHEINPPRNQSSAFQIALTDLKHKRLTLVDGHSPSSLKLRDRWRFGFKTQKGDRVVDVKNTGEVEVSDSKASAE